MSSLGEMVKPKARQRISQKTLEGAKRLFRPTERITSHPPKGHPPTTTVDDIGSNTATVTSHIQMPVANDVFGKQSDDTDSFTASCSLRGSAKMAWDGFRLLASKAEKVFEGTPVKIPVATLNTVLEIANAYMDNDSAMRTTLDQIGDRLHIVNQALDSKQSKVARNRGEEFYRRLIKIEEEVTIMKKRGILQRIAQSQEDEKALQDLLDMMSRATEDFQIHLSLTIERNVEDLEDLVRKDRLDKWLLAPEAIYASADAPRVVCTPGTREYVLSKIRHWVDDAAAPSVFWLAGRAGTGKSTIANTIAGEYERHHKFCPSFFCSTQLPTTRARVNLIPTVASVLARVSSSYRDALLNIDMGPILRRPDKHIEDMLVTPWTNAHRAKNLPPVLIVVDALDELEAENGQSAGAKFIQQLILHVHELRGLKFLVTSRHEPGVVEHCKSLEAFYHLEDADAEELRQDIATYLLAELPDLRDHQLLTRLVDQSDGLFIYAATAVRFINVTNVQSERLEQLYCMTQRWPKREEQEKEGLAVDKAYLQILQNALPEATARRRRMLSVLHTILCAEEPLAAASIAALLRVQDHNITEGIVKNTAQQLHAVLREDNISGCIYVYHQSFRDYMLDSRRCGVSVVCKRPEQNFFLAKGCFHVMTSGLKFNICDLPSSFLLDKQVTDLEERVKERIPSDLRYASRRWASHIAATLGIQAEVATETDTANFALYLGEFVKYIQAFCANQLLFWMEIMNLIGLRGECSKALNLAHESLISSETELALLKKDLQAAENLAISFASNPASKSTPHLYISILSVYNGNSPLLQAWKNKFRRLPLLEGHRRVERLLSALFLKTVAFSLGISDDGKLIVAGMEDGSIYVWDSTTGEEKMKLEGHSDAVTSVLFSFDAKNISSASWDGTVCVWDSVTGDRKLGISRHDVQVETKSAPFSTGCKRVGSTVGKALSERKKMRKESDDLLCAASFSPDGKFIVSAMCDRNVHVWDVETGNKKLTLKDHNSTVTTISFSPDGKYILSASKDGTIHLWNFATGQEERKLEGHTRAVTAASFSSDGNHILSIANDRTVRVWDAKTGNEELKLMTHSEYTVAASFSFNSKRIVSAGADCCVCVFNAITGEEELALHHNSVIVTALFSHTGNHVVSATEDKTVRVWDATGERDSSMDVEGHSDVVTASSFSNDGQRIISASWDGTVRIWDAVSGREVLVLNDFKAKVWNASVSRDGRRIVTSVQDGTVQVWDAMTGTEELNLKGHNDYVWAVSFSPDGLYAVSGSFDTTVRVWNLVAGKEELQLMGHSHYVKAVSFSPDGKRIVSASSDKTARVWDVATGSEKLRINHSDQVWAASFSPDSKRIVSGSEFGAIRVWDAATGRKELTLKGHSDVVRAVSFSNDGKRIVSASHDGTVRVWDAVTGSEELTFLFGHGVPVTAASFSPDGKCVVSAADDSTVRVWDVAKSPGEHWTVDDHGWIVSPQSERLMWVSSDVHQTLRHPQCQLIISRHGYISADFENTLLGEHWADCYIQA